MALTVTFTVCDAQQIGSSSSQFLSWAQLNLASASSMLPEQKAPSLLAPLAISQQTFAVRRSQDSTSGEHNPSDCFHYALVLPSCRTSLSSRSNSYETTRGPPRMDPPIPC